MQRPPSCHFESVSGLQVNIIIYLVQMSAETAAAQLSPMHRAADSGSEEEEEEFEEVFVDVPYQYQVEEVREREELQDDVVEKKIPQVKAMYPYSKDGLNMKKGEVGNLGERSFCG